MFVGWGVGGWGGGTRLVYRKSPTNIYDIFVFLKGTWNQSSDNNISQFYHYILSFCARLHVRTHKDARSLKLKMCNRSQLSISAGGKMWIRFSAYSLPSLWKIDSGHNWLHRWIRLCRVSWLWFCSRSNYTLSFLGDQYNSKDWSYPLLLPCWSVLFDSLVSSTMDLLTELGHGGSRDWKRG